MIYNTGDEILFPYNKKYYIAEIKYKCGVSRQINRNGHMYNIYIKEKDLMYHFVHDTMFIPATPLTKVLYGIEEK